MSMGSIENYEMASTFVHQSRMNDSSSITSLFYGHRCHPFHGMIRANTLKATSLVGSYPSSDLVLVGELVLHGELQTPEHLFFKEIILTHQCERITETLPGMIQQKKGSFI